MQQLISIMIMYDLFPFSPFPLPLPPLTSLLHSPLSSQLLFFFFVVSEVSPSRSREWFSRMQQLISIMILYDFPPFFSFPATPSPSFPFQSVDFLAD